MSALQPGGRDPAGEDHPGFPVVVGEGTDQQRPAGVAPLAVGGEQRFEVVQHQQQPGVLKQGAQARQEVLQARRGSDLVDHREPVVPELRLQRYRQQAQRVTELVGVGGRRPERQRLKGPLVAVGQLQRARGLARADHPVKHHHAALGGWGQGGAGGGHRLGAADEPRRLRWEPGHHLLGRIQDRLPDRRGQGQACRRGPEDRRSAHRYRRPGRRRGGSRRSGHGSRDRPVQQLGVAKHPVVERIGEPEGEIIEHRVAHRDHRTSQLRDQRPRHPHRARLPGLLGCLGLQLSGRVVQTQPAQRLRGGRRRRLARRDHRQLDPRPHRPQQSDQLCSGHRIRRAVRPLQQELPRPAVPGQMQHIPPVPGLGQIRQHLPGHPVLGDLQLHPPPSPAAIRRTSRDSS